MLYIMLCLMLWICVFMSGHVSRCYNKSLIQSYQVGFIHEHNNTPMEYIIFFHDTKQPCVALKFLGLVILRFSLI